MPAYSFPSCPRLRRDARCLSSNVWFALVAVLASALLSGCADTKYLMRLDPEVLPENAVRVWPAAPETPRFRYVGQLLGEENFVPDNSRHVSTGQQLLRWIVGMFDGQEDKLVLRRPQTGMVDSRGRIYVSDVSNQAVLVFDKDGGRLLVMAYAEEGRTFVTPIGVAEGANGEILVADAELGRVFRLDAEGKPLGSFGKDVLVRPTGVARDAQRGRIYVSDTHAHDVKVFDDEGRLIDAIGHRGEEEGTLNYPTHLAFADDRLYVTDGMNARVQVFDLEGRLITAIGQRGIYYGNLTRPKGVTVDTRGNIYVVESFYDNLLVFNSEGRFLMPIGGTGKEIGQFYLPSGVWSDGQNRIYVADMFNGRVVIFQLIGES